MPEVKADKRTLNQRFLDMCSPGELLEIMLLLQRPEYQDKICQAMTWRIALALMLEEVNYYNESSDYLVTIELLTALAN